MGIDLFYLFIMYLMYIYIIVVNFGDYLLPFSGNEGGFFYKKFFYTVLACPRRRHVDFSILQEIKF